MLCAQMQSSIPEFTPTSYLVWTLCYYLAGAFSEHLCKHFIHVFKCHLHFFQTGTIWGVDQWTSFQNEFLTLIDQAEWLWLISQRLLLQHLRQCQPAISRPWQIIPKDSCTYYYNNSNFSLLFTQTRSLFLHYSQTRIKNLAKRSDDYSSSQKYSELSETQSN